MIVYVDYASPSALEVRPDAAALTVACDARRPVRFHGTVVQHAFLLRIALRALGQAIWSDDSWMSAGDLLDPVVTVHPDRLLFEGFSQDQSVYAALVVDPAVFEIHGEVIPGTTNIDFTAWLWGALGELRSSRTTTLRIGVEGMTVATAGAGGRFEKKVDLPDAWVRGFLHTQAAMAMPGTRLQVRPVDLLAAIRFLRFTKAKVSPRAIRYEFTPGEDARLVLEPWEQVIPLVGCTHGYTEPKTTRVWGRRRLALLEGLLPFADGVDVYLEGRALPSFYAVHLPGMTFVLGTTGFSASSFTGTGGFAALASIAGADDALVAAALAHLRRVHHASVDEIAAELAIDRPRATAVLTRLCRQGRCMFDVETRRHRHRELFAEAADEARYFPPDRRRELADELLAQVSVRACTAEENSKLRTLATPEGRITRTIVHRDWRVLGRVGAADPVEIVVDDGGRMIFGRCTCPFFAEHLMNQGPCEHMIALFDASAPERRDLPSSAPADPARLELPRLAPSRGQLSDDGA